MATGPLSSNRRKVLPIHHLGDLSVQEHRVYQTTKVPVDSVLWDFNQTVRAETAFRLDVRPGRKLPWR